MRALFQIKRTHKCEEGNLPAAGFSAFHLESMATWSWSPPLMSFIGRNYSVTIPRAPCRRISLKSSSTARESRFPSFPVKSSSAALPTYAPTLQTDFVQPRPLHLWHKSASLASLRSLEDCQNHISLLVHVCMRTYGTQTRTFEGPRPGSNLACQTHG